MAKRRGAQWTMRLQDHSAMAVCAATSSASYNAGLNRIGFPCIAERSLRNLSTDRALARSLLTHHPWPTSPGLHLSSQTEHFHPTYPLELSTLQVEHTFLHRRYVPPPG
jgi:hypothetical protein